MASSLGSVEAGDCIICYSTVNEKQGLTFDCNCSVCVVCMMINLKLNRIHGYRNLECPRCSDLDRNEEQENRILSELRQLASGDQSYSEVVEKFEISLKSSVLQGKNMTYCSHPPCSSCQERVDRNRTMTCNKCKKKTCHDCKLPWHRQHKNTKCEIYKVWVQKNMPEWYIPADMEDACFICPNCKSQFEMVRGGCLHFDCPSCKLAFCGFCRETFYSPKRNPCPICEESKRKGMHAHHPRICPYFLRDKEVDWLWTLVEEHDQKMDDLLPFNPAMKNDKCGLKYKTDRGIRCCKKPIEERCQGFCERHFQESVSFAIFRAKTIDPIILMTKDELMILADREKVEYQKEWTEDTLRKVIVEKLPVIVEMEEPFFSCPKCKMKYSIVREGSCHWDCQECFISFCGFCRMIVYRPREYPCPICPEDNKRGIHAHHNRCCPYYLRDKEVEWFYALLEKHGKKIDDVLRPNPSTTENCGFRYFDGASRRICSSSREEKCQGYCVRHFQQLISEVILTSKQIDPIVLMNENQLKALLNRECVKFEDNCGPTRLREIIAEEIPLKKCLVPVRKSSAAKA